MTDPFVHPHGATPFDESDADELVPTWISTRRELDSEEAQNIAGAMLWAFGRSWSITDFDQAMLKDLHARMFDHVWKWAGRYRQAQTNIGVDWDQIQTQTENLLLDLREQTRDPERLPWPAAELAVRFHYRLVTIHPFRNGNGRHARLAGDLVMVALGGSPLGWGADSTLSQDGPARSEYIHALREADSTNTFTRLVGFATS